jgi:hypothetical protein
MNYNESNTHIFGSNPANILWSIVRGDTAKLRVSFLEKNEVDEYDTTGWTYDATAHDSKTDTTYPLTIVLVDEYVDIIAPAELTELWGMDKSGSIVAELSFDLQVSFPVVAGSGNPWPEIWTPIIGTISVMADVTGGSSNS